MSVIPNQPEVPNVVLGLKNPTGSVLTVHKTNNQNCVGIGISDPQRGNAVYALDREDRDALMAVLIAMEMEDVK